MPWLGLGFYATTLLSTDFPFKMIARSDANDLQS